MPMHNRRTVSEWANEFVALQESCTAILKASGYLLILSTASQTNLLLSGATDNTSVLQPSKAKPKLGMIPWPAYEYAT